MQIADFTPGELRRQLNAEGLRIKTGPFVFAIRSSLAPVCEGLFSLYDAFEIPPRESFADFHISVEKAKGLRRWVRPQSIFEFDGAVPFKPLAANQGFALLEWGMNWCIYNHAHAYLIIHGAVLERHGQALLLPAPSGSGKSTLCGALMSRGWRLLSDELILLNPDDGLIYPLGRPISLKNSSIDVLRAFAPEHFISEPIHDTAKGSVAHMKPTQGSVMRNNECAQPRWAIFPKYTKGIKTKLAPIGKPDLCMRLIDNAFNYNIHGVQGFMSMTSMVSNMTAFTATYESLDEVIALIDQITINSNDVA